MASPKNGKPKFTRAERVKIRRRYFKTTVSQNTLAAELGIAITTLKRIIYGRNRQDQ